jgi:hypothetical protein
MAHLTNYTFSRLCRKLNVNQDINLDLFLKEVFNNQDVFKIFNKIEVNFLFIYRQILEDAENFQINYYQEVPERIDSKRMVFEKAGKLKYHTNINCQFINKNFLDFNIPEDIINLGDEVVEEYRSWFKLKGYADAYFSNQLDISKVVFDYNMKFPPKYQIPILNENYKLITEILNSNDISIEDNFDYETFLANLDNLIKKHQNIFSCKTTRTISKFDYLLEKSKSEIEEKISEIFSDVFIENYGLERLKSLFRQSKSVKKDIMSNILNYFKWNYKLKDKNFDNITLEQFGLICCEGCKKESNNIVSK